MAQRGTDGRGQQTRVVAPIFKAGGGGGATRTAFLTGTKNVKTFEKPLTSTFARSPR
jgi:hypothetical protein